MFKRNKINNLLLVLMALMFGLPFTARADIESYTLEQGIPFVGGAGQTLSYDNFSALFQKFITAVYIIAAVAAFIKIFLAGLKWYTSSGSAKAISQAREDIKNALMGLAFLFLAGTLLVFINPNLNKISSIFIGDIKVTPTTTPTSELLPISKGDNVLRSTKAFTGNDGVVLFKQDDSRWGSLKYPDAAHPLSENGCVPTSIAMVVTKLTGSTVTPADLYAKIEDNLSHYVTADGNSQNYADMANLYGIKAVKTSDPEACLNNGGIPTAVVGGGYGVDNPCKQLLNVNSIGGHMIVITGINNSQNTGYLNVNDPYYSHNTNHMYVAAEENLIKVCASSIWCFTK